MKSNQDYFMVGMQRESVHFVNKLNKINLHCNLYFDSFTAEAKWAEVSWERLV